MGSAAESSDDDLSFLETSLNAKLPTELRNLFKKAKNFPSDEKSPFRLMAPNEVASNRKATGQFVLNWRGCCAFWTDDKSNFAALYLAGPLSGKVCFLDHGALDLSPVYRSLSSFLEALHLAAKQGKDWYEMPTDYPTPTDYYFHHNGKPSSVTDLEQKNDLAVVEVLRRLLDQLPSTEEAERRYLCFCIIGLTPQERLDIILEFLSDKDMWVQERAAQCLGFRRYLPAIQRLADLALSGIGNGVSAAISALGRLGTADCLESLLKCVTARANSYAPGLGYALKACGCEATQDRGEWRFRLPGEENWRTIN